MEMTTSPDKFAAQFNVKVPGAYRRITSQDVRDMTECGLIGRYRNYPPSDLQTVIGILTYEQLRAERDRKEDKTKICKRCGKPLPENGGRKGRPNEYCADCEPFRGEGVEQEVEKQTNKSVADLNNCHASVALCPLALKAVLPTRHTVFFAISSPINIQVRRQRVETTINRTWMPTVAGILDIVAGALSILCFVGVMIAFFFIPVSMSVGPGPTQEFGLWSIPILAGTILAFAALLKLIFSVLSILGGVYALQRRKWGLALTGAIVVALANQLLGIPALILTVLSKEEFRRLPDMTKELSYKNSNSPQTALI